jgi:hypothetical protein
MKRTLRKWMVAAEHRDVTGWVLLAAGLLMAAVAMVTPAWLEANHLRAQVRIMDDQMSRMQTEQASYEQYVAALNQGDPLILQRLAWGELNLKPAGAQILAQPSNVGPASTARFESWLSGELQPTDAPPSMIPDTMLVHWTSGSHRLWLGGAAAMLIAWGLLRGLPTKPDSR